MNRCRRILAAALAAVMLLALTACGQSADTNNSAEQTVVRIGTPAVTTRGLTVSDMEPLAHCIRLTVHDFDANRETILQTVKSITDRYPIYNI